jgi:hypothetical protein
MFVAQLFSEVEVGNPEIARQKSISENSVWYASSCSHFLSLVKICVCYNWKFDDEQLVLANKQNVYFSTSCIIMYDSSKILDMFYCDCFVEQHDLLCSSGL